MIVIGSYPIQKLLGRESRDLDVLGTLPAFQEYIGQGNRPTLTDQKHAHFKSKVRIYDCELIWPDSDSFELAELILSDPNTKFDAHVNAWVPSLNVLYMLKMSHRYKKNSPHFLKTMRDIQKMRAAGAFVQREHMDFYKRRMAATYDYSHPNLNQDKGGFFRPEDNFYEFDHDSIHEAVALDGDPAYTKYAVEGAEVLSSKQKFFSVDERTRLLGVYEEASVLALERSQIPNRFSVDPEWSFKMALMKVCTSITSGWFRQYAWENYDRVMALYEGEGKDGYIWRMLANKHKLRPYEGKQ